MPETPIPQQVDPEIMRRVQRFADAYSLGAEARQPGGSPHEERVRLHWKDALTAFLYRHIKTHNEVISRRTVNTTYSLEPDDDLRCAMIRFLAAHFDWPLDQMLQIISDCGSEAIDRKKRAGLPWIFSPFLLLAGFVLWIGLDGNPMQGPILLLTGACALLLAALMTARRSGLRRAARQGGDAAKVLERYCDIWAAGPLKNISMPLLAVCAALLVGASFFYIQKSLPPTADVRAADILTGYNSTVPTRHLDSLLLKDGRITADSAETLAKARDSFEPGTEHALQAAIYAWQRVGAGYPEDDARAALTAQIEALDLKDFCSESNLSLLNRMLEDAPWTDGPLFEAWLRTGDPENAEMAVLVGNSARGLTLEDKLRSAKTAQAQGLPGGCYLAAALTDEERTQLQAGFSGEDDPAALAVLGRALTWESRSPDEILPVLRLLKEKGIRLGEVYPGGIEVDMDLSALNPDREEGGLIQPGEGRILILSRTEINEPFQQLSKQPSAGHDGHDKNDPGVFTVRIDAAAMDRLPAERVPASPEECGLLIVSDMTFAYCGCITGTVHSKSGPEAAFFPAYQRHWRLLVAGREGAHFTWDEMTTGNAETDSAVEVRSIADLFRVGVKFLPGEERSWADARLSALLDAFDEAGWDWQSFFKQQILPRYPGGPGAET